MTARNHTSLIEVRGMRFLITDRPNDKNVAEFLEILQNNGVTDLVRVCTPSYNTDKVEEAGVSVHDWEFTDGDPPPREISDLFVTLVRNTFQKNKQACIAIHCVAGLGRAPVMVALAMIEVGGMTPEDAVLAIREKRRGAINTKQFNFLIKYKPAKKRDNCSIM